MAMNTNEELLVALRQIVHAIDLHSKKLYKEVGLTGPQLVILRAIESTPAIVPKRVAETVNLSQGTVTTILDRLQARRLISRERSTIDKRKLHLSLTAAGQNLLKAAPTPLQQDFLQRFNALETWEQTQILSSVQRLAVMMNAENLDAEPMLELGEIAAAEPAG